ncbi:MAG: SDR family oxidoreductase [Verrucomicrobia bacterium]|nr:SDR family oxidoreductase [Verrucomicrobiota bacterium]
MHSQPPGPTAAKELFSLRGKRALVTGSGQGIGLTLARGLGAAGAELVLNDLDPARLEQAVATLRGEGLVVTGRRFDVAKAEEVGPAFVELERTVGPLDILVNNAGIHRRAPLETMPAASWQAVLDVNLTSAFLVTRAVASGMIERGGGKIINICSLNSELSRPTIANYAAAKGGLKMLTRAMAVEWGRHNLQANGIAPGYIRTDMTGGLVVDPEFDRYIRARTPAGRWGEPRELVGAAVFLASRASDFVNGQILYVDGGLLASQ